MKHNTLFFVGCLLYCCFGWAQEQDTLARPANQEVQILTEETIREPYDPLAPSRAAFYSAVIPGLGQAYNERYWKIPIVYAGIGTSIYFYIENNDNHQRYRDAYKRRLAGFTDDEFQGISRETLIRAQRTTKRNRDVSLAIAVGFYLLNIIDANVDAHLKQYNVSEDLSVQPKIDYNQYLAETNYGVTLSYRLK